MHAYFVVSKIVIGGVLISFCNERRKAIIYEREKERKSEREGYNPNL